MKITERKAELITVAGMAVSLIGGFAPLDKPLAVALILAGAPLIYLGGCAQTYLWGRERGQCEALKVEIQRVWSEQMPFNVSDTK